MAVPSPSASRPTTGRLDALDLARGAALAAMAAYHSLWDLGFLQLTPENYALTPPGRLAAHGIAGSFLLLVGIGLVLAHRGGLRPRAVLGRFARIGGAAALITVATAYAFPQSYIFFGILHCIAVGSLLGLPFVFAPVAVTALAAVAVLLAPSLVAHPVLDLPALLFLGLGRTVPDTNDWVPLCPWFGVILAGIALARLGLPGRIGERLGRWRAQGRFLRGALFAGRHSLAIYLLHQPILLALFSGLVTLSGPHPDAGAAQFRASYAVDCTRAGGGAESCRTAARCTQHALRREGLWGLGAPYSAEQRARAQGLSQACYQAAEGTEPPSEPPSEPALGR
ncbi:heparan-alpha-glucosaminide N-acetyltransferase [Methylobacterium sp. Leaf118]|uniref:heparan-alpha-glucosaminide N-acetyltransferase n=1 Tax=Methylobacterium sp. Leaf118 TaxID=2876562 RepID=UPI001E556336|nr:heparan-alpha-glucosaminide N-acetyltransferase [Methylobacterium sp. Leaf118]